MFWAMLIMFLVGAVCGALAVLALWGYSNEEQLSAIEGFEGAVRAHERALAEAEVPKPQTFVGSDSNVPGTEHRP